jgi:hypothetical protein
MNVNDIADFFLQLEGPYRWYVIGGILIILTAVISRFIFKTLKWFLIIAATAVVIVAIIQYFTPIDLLATLQDIK